MSSETNKVCYTAKENANNSCRVIAAVFPNHHYNRGKYKVYSIVYCILILYSIVNIEHKIIIQYCIIDCHIIYNVLLHIKIY